MIAIMPPGMYFNPRSREGSDRPLAEGSTLHVDFNPRSREGSDVGEQSPTTHRRISIHAPVKGATSLIAVLALRNGISIHAPVKGATG